MLCAAYSRPQEEIRHSILWSKLQTEKEQQQPMATKKGGKKYSKRPPAGKKPGGKKPSGKKPGGKKPGGKKPGGKKPGYGK
jgi:hypothetical protein